MEDLNTPLDAGMNANASDQRLRITESVRSDWSEIAKWTMFLAVLLFIFLGLVGLGALFVSFTRGTSGIVGAIFVLGFYSVILFFPAWYYYKFSIQTRQALNNEANDALEEGFTNLRRYYRYVGILTIVIISLYLLVLIAIMVGAGAGAFSNF